MYVNHHVTILELKEEIQRNIRDICQNFITQIHSYQRSRHEYFILCLFTRIYAYK